LVGTGTKETLSHYSRRLEGFSELGLLGQGQQENNGLRLCWLGNMVGRADMTSVTKSVEKVLGKVVGKVVAMVVATDGLCDSKVGSGDIVGGVQLVAAGDAVFCSFRPSMLSRSTESAGVGKQEDVERHTAAVTATDNSKNRTKQQNRKQQVVAPVKPPLLRRSFSFPSFSSGHPVKSAVVPIVPVDSVATVCISIA
jgi:hypothetical protein